MNWHKNQQIKHTQGTRSMEFMSLYFLNPLAHFDGLNYLKKQLSLELNCRNLYEYSNLKIASFMTAPIHENGCIHCFVRGTV